MTEQPIKFRINRHLPFCERWTTTPRVLIRKITKGVYTLNIYVGKGSDDICHTGGGLKYSEGIIFERGKECLQIEFAFPSTGYIFGQVNKGTYYGTFYEYNTYQKLMSDKSKDYYKSK